MIYFNDWNITEVDDKQQDQEFPLPSSSSLPPRFHVFLPLRVMGRKWGPQTCNKLAAGQYESFLETWGRIIVV